MLPWRLKRGCLLFYTGKLWLIFKRSLLWSSCVGWICWYDRHVLWNIAELLLKNWLICIVSCSIVPQWNPKALDLLKGRIYSLEWEVITFTIISSCCVSYIKTFSPSPVINLQMCSIFYVSNNEIISDLTEDEIRLCLLKRRPHSAYMKSKSLLFNHL